MRGHAAILLLLAPTSSWASELPNALRPLGACRDLRPASGLTGAAFGQLGARYEALFAAAGDFQEVRLDRATLGACAAHASGAHLVLGAEAIRSATPDSLLGVDGDSIVLRLEYAFGSYQLALGPGELSVDGGLIADPWIQALERRSSARPTFGERAAFFEASDLGASISYRLFGERLRVSVAYGNGEGRTEVEQNTGKDVTVVLGGDPLDLDLLGGRLTVGLHAVLRDGSIGVGEARNHRLGGAITAVHPRGNLGVEVVHARGYLGRGEREALGIGAWLDTTIIDPWLGVVARIDRLDADLSASDAASTATTLGLFTDVISQTEADAPFRLRVHLTWQHAAHGLAAPPLPGADLDADRLALVLEGSAFLAPSGAPTEAE